MIQNILPPDNSIFEEGAKFMSHCPVCHCQYNPVEVKVLEEDDGANLIYLRCRQCWSSVLALIMANNFGLSSVGLVTDLDSREVAKFKDSSEIASNDVLTVYQLLSSDKNLKEIIMK